MITHVKQPELTAREMQILGLLAQGNGTSEIAKRLHLDYKSVAEISKGIKSKLQINTLAELSEYAAKYLDLEQRER